LKATKNSAIFCFCLFCCVLSGARVEAQMAPPKNPVESEVSPALAQNLIAQVKKIPVSKLDDGLPKTSLESWLQSSVGPEATTAWVYRSGCTGDRRAPKSRQDCVEADVALAVGRSLVVMIAVGKTSARSATVFSVNLLEGGQGKMDVTRLRDLPKLLGSNTSKSDFLEAV
jgi:hypothetical protein